MSSGIIKVPISDSILSRVVKKLHGFFDWLYGSRYNPLYRSGALAMVSLVILLITGVYLLLFYQLGDPYGSLQSIQHQRFVGRWIRALHRYATDVAVIAVFFHILQMLIQAKTWGPRVLAWLSGVVLLICLLVSAWTGYVMIWDQHALAIAMGGTKILQSIFPFLTDLLNRAFDGSTPVNPSFFFMNLFLHVAIPLMIIFGMWVHTAKLARTRWFPERRVSIFLTASLIILAMVWPAPLLPRADLLLQIGHIKWDWWVTFFLPNESTLSPIASLLFFSAVILTLATFPLWVRPKNISHSVVDVDGCSGCTQCVRDCPYEVIKMIPHPNGRHLLAEVDATNCVSCAICTASCADLAIGPPGRDGMSLMRSLDEMLIAEDKRLDKNSLVIIPCEYNGQVYSRLQDYAAQNTGVFLFPANCCGTVHTKVIERLLDKVGGVVITACPERDCYNRDGLELVRQRVLEKRVPFLARKVERSRILILSYATAEYDRILNEISDFRDFAINNKKTRDRSRKDSLIRNTRLTVATVVALLGVAYISALESGTDPTTGIFRISLRLPSYVKEGCSTSIDESSPLKHMQQPQLCKSKLLSYRLKIYSNQSLLKEVLQRAKRDDRPVVINEDIVTDPTIQNMRVDLFSVNGDQGDEKLINSWQQDVDIKAREIVLLTYNQASGFELLR